MTKAMALKQLKEAAELSRADPEAGHGFADRVLCDFIASLGYQEIVDAFDNVSKWYA